MNKLGHFVVAICFIVVLVVFLPHYIPLSDKESLLLFTSIICFSVIWSPDIDCVLPVGGHRKFTHSLLFIPVIAVILWVGLGFALTQMNQAEMTAFTPLISIGFLLGWILHVGTDMVYDRIKQLTWLVLAVILVMVWIYAK